MGCAGVNSSISQAALLYTTSCGERRIRVHNVALPVETVIQNVFDSVNIDVLCNILAKQALEVLFYHNDVTNVSSVSFGLGVV